MYKPTSDFQATIIYAGEENDPVVFVFNRVFETHHKTLDMIPTSYFRNDFMDGDDAMKMSDIKVNLPLWLKKHGLNPKKVKYTYVY